MTSESEKSQSSWTRRLNRAKPVANLVHDRLTATIAKGCDDIDWAGFAQEVSESAGLRQGQ